MDELAAAGFAAGCFPRLGAGLGAGLATVGASSFLGIHFSSGMSRVNYNLSPKVWPNPQVPRADFAQTTSAILCNMTLLRFFLETAGDGSPPQGGDGHGG